MNFSKGNNPGQMAKVLKILGKAWVPHKGQTRVGKAVFNSPSDIIYVECGRKWGKSECAVYLCWMYAATRPNAEVYYLAPLVKQAKELVWVNNRMQSCNTYADWFIPEMERALGGPIKILSQDGRILLPNGSFIKVDGSDNVESQRGLKPDFVVADEYRDFKPNWIETVRPNMAVKRGRMLFITTPPHAPNHAYELAREAEEAVAEGNEYYFYINTPTFENDRIEGHHEWLEREKARLYKAGRENEWRREYMAEFILDNEHAVLPQLNKGLLEDADSLLAGIRSCGDRVQWVLSINPGNSTVFGALLAAFDPKTATLYIVDALYEWNSDKASIRLAGEKLKELCAKYDLSFGSDVDPFGDSDGLGILDSEEDDQLTIVVNCRYPWLARDLYECHKVGVSESDPHTKQAEYNINLIKDICIAECLRISTDASQLVREAERYTRNSETLKLAGARNTENQTLLIECLKYVLDAVGYTFDTLPEPKQRTETQEFERRIRGMQRLEDLLYENQNPDAESLWEF
jgi:hypothetical protein